MIELNHIRYSYKVKSINQLLIGT